jgi:hypothetical protein
VPVFPAGYTPPASTAPPPTVTATAPAAAKIPFEVTGIKDAHPGKDVTVAVKTAPGAAVKITFVMPNGTESTYPAEREKTAGADGVVSWTWNINSHVPAGEASFVFLVKANGLEETFTVKQTI